DQFAIAARAVDICADQFPTYNQAALTEAAPEFQVNFLARNSSIPFFIAGGNRVAFAARANQGRPACIVLLDNMTTDEAEALIQPWITRIGGAEFQDDRGRVHKAWNGTLQGQAVDVRIFLGTDVAGIDGAALELLAR
ncbi:MAG: hypothetical protein AAFX00_05195, partial [Pseudomonadota bacterium]